MHAVVVGGGVAGLGTALSLSRRGHRVTVLERDDTPMPDSPAAAFAWDRRGAPQVRHSHALLGRLHNLLRDEHPDVLAALLDAGATEIRQADRMPDTLDDRTPMPGDDDLTLIASRRTTFEWVLRRAVLGTEGVEVRTGVAVSGLCGDRTAAVPHVDGVVLDDGTLLGADLVVAANGRRSTVPDWLAEIGVTMPDEEVEDTGIVYASRFFELEPGEAYPGTDRLVGGDLTYLKFGVFWGDNDTFSLTLAIDADDTVLRNAIKDPAVFDAIGRQIPAVAPWLDGRAHAITEVHSMAGLLNRRRRFVVDQMPVVTGLVAVGDAHVCTNPLYGRGCSTGMWQADLLARAADDHGEDAASLAVAYDAAVNDQVEPWYRSSVDSDRSARRAIARAKAVAAGEDVPEESGEQIKRSILREGLSPATRTDAVVWRAFCRTMNLLAPPNHLLEPDIGARVMKVWQDRANRPPEPPLGPPREEMIAAVGVA
jgi:2-polyprenyl-6-methoxyphenol hydroxylase-like FAD-dependent oxidoreductase